MRNKEIALELDAIIKSDILDDAENRVLEHARDLLKTSVFTMLHMGYRQGFCDAVARGIKGTNIHITATTHANCYAMQTLRAIDKEKEAAGVAARVSLQG